MAFHIGAPSVLDGDVSRPKQFRGFREATINTHFLKFIGTFDETKRMMSCGFSWSDEDFRRVATGSVLLGRHSGGRKPTLS